ncbi:hypothetical protein FACS189487_07780 [Campylobacterota bacterium]|nr:hypothetical protein FACS189487_07780 [Campylobacterota bacterium]
MADQIANVIQRGNLLVVTDAKGKQLFTLSVAQNNEEFKGYTASTVSVRRGNLLYTYDSKGKQLSTTSAR